MQTGSNQCAAVIQVTKNPTTTHTIIQQNGQHILVGKLGDSTSAGHSSSVSTDATALVTDSTGGNSGTQSVQTIFPTQYIEASAEQTVYSNSTNSVTGGQVGFLTLNKDTQLRRLYTSAPKIEYGQYHEYAPIIYTPVCGNQTYYQTVGGQVLASTGFSAAGGSLVGAGSSGTTHHAQIVTHQGTTYILQSGTTTLEEDAAALSHTAKASPLTVQWLVDNYETAEGVSLPRSTLYFHYLQHCHENKLEPMNPASFGKLIRSVFLGLRTRRLGTRGNSKYHYYGIRIKPSSQLNHFVEDSSFALRHYPNYHRQSMEAVAEWKSLASTGKTGSISAAAGVTGSGGAGSGTFRQGGYQGGGVGFGEERVCAGSGGASSSSMPSSSASTLGAIRTGALGGGQSKHQHAQFLGESTSALPNLNEICRSAGLPVPRADDVDLFPRVRNSSGSSNAEISGGGGGGLKASSTASSSSSKKSSSCLDGLPVKDLNRFSILYAQSAGNMLDAVVNLDFSSIAGAWKAFWRTGELQENSVFEKTLPRERLHALSKNVVVHQFIRLYDHTFYQSLAEVLIPNVLRPIPPTLTQAIRNFAKHLEVWMREALHDLDPVLLRLKLSAVSALAQTLRRYTSLNHLAQAARAVLKNSSQINQMLIDLSRVDFNNVQEQASWVCQCSDATVAHLEQDFKYILQKQSTLEEWAQWLDTVVTGILRPLEGNNLAYTRAAHQLILKWSFYSSMVIRDLTLRSAASFGSFHLIRLLYDEYIFYLVEHKVAAHLGMTPVAVMGEMGRAVTRPHYNLSRATAAALVAPAGNTVASESRAGVSGITSIAPTKPGKLEPVLSATPSNASTKVQKTAPLPIASEHLHPHVEDPVEAATDETVCGAFEADAVFPRPSMEAEEEDELDDEEVDEYLEDGDDADDTSMGDENAMLRRAHESALLKAAAEALEKNAPLPAIETAASTTSTAANGASEVAAADEASKSSDVVSSGDNCQQTEEITITVVDEAAVSEEPQEGCDSPPPIVAHTTHARKVVRVTTFDENRTRALATASNVAHEAVMNSSTTTASTTSVATVSAPAVVSLIIPSEAKRARF